MPVSLPGIAHLVTTVPVTAGLDDSQAGSERECKIPACLSLTHTTPAIRVAGNRRAPAAEAGAAGSRVRGRPADRVAAACSVAFSRACRCPSIRLDTDFLNSQLASPPVLQFEHLPLEWGDVQVSAARRPPSAMRSHDALDESDFRRVEALCRDADGCLLPLRSWYEAAKPGRRRSIPMRPDSSPCSCRRCVRSSRGRPTRSWPRAISQAGRAARVRCARASRTSR